MEITDGNEVFTEIQSWDELDINNELLRGIYSNGFERPSPIQSKAIKPLISGRDLLAQAPSGTGKTATFTIGALANVNTKNNYTQVISLSPTRELTTQTAEVFKSIGESIKGLRVQTLFGGVGGAFEEKNVFMNKNIPHVICGCPGRVYNMIKNGKINCKNVKLIILDEADELLSIGFKDQVYNIFQYLNNDAQVALFSATLPEHVFSVVDKIMRNPVKICVVPEKLTLEGIKQYFVGVEDDMQKYDSLKNIFGFLSVSQCIIYCNSVKRVADLYEAMREDDFPVCCIYSDMEKVDRDQAFNSFKNGKYRVLISTNLTARGIDIQQVNVVINFDVPKCVNSYLHRIGRSGRWGRKGVGINFITKRDIIKLKEIESHYKCQIDELPSDLNFLKTV